MLNIEMIELWRLISLILDISVKERENDNLLFYWVSGNIDSQIISHICDSDINVERVVSKEVYSDNLNKDNKFISMGSATTNITSWC